MKRKNIIVLVLLISSIAVFGKISIVPQPVSVIELPGEFRLDKNATISYDDGLKEYAEYLEETLSRPTGGISDWSKGKGRVPSDWE